MCSPAAPLPIRICIPPAPPPRRDMHSPSTVAHGDMHSLVAAAHRDMHSPSAAAAAAAAAAAGSVWRHVCRARVRASGGAVPCARALSARRSVWRMAFVGAELSFFFACCGARVSCVAAAAVTWSCVWSAPLRVAIWHSRKFLMCAGAQECWAADVCLVVRPRTRGGGVTCDGALPAQLVRSYGFVGSVRVRAVRVWAAPIRHVRIRVRSWCGGSTRLWRRGPTGACRTCVCTSRFRGCLVRRGWGGGG